MEKDFGIYIGICIQNNDSEMRGRIKVYVPQLAPNITKLNANVDTFFNFLGKNNPDIIKVVDELKDLLPWAEYAGPMFGGGASGRFNASNETSTTSDSNAWDGNNVADGARPANNYVGVDAYPDVFIQTMGNQNRKVNEYAYQYTPSNYSNLARGMFSIPNVGAHVYIFFVNGDRNFPVYFASAYSEEDVKRIFTLSQDVRNNSSVDHPETYENIKADLNSSGDAKTFRSKSVFNSNKHTIEMIDTDLREIMKFTHYSGSFKEFNNYATIELATNNDQKMVLGNQFLTTQKNKSEFVRFDNEKIIFGDHYKTVGNPNPTAMKEILKIQANIHDLKMLFDTQRTAPDSTSKTPKVFISSLQKKTYIKRALCPVCQESTLRQNPLATTPVPWFPYDALATPDINMQKWKTAPKYKGSCWDMSEFTSDADGHVGANGDITKSSGTGISLSKLVGGSSALTTVQQYIGFTTGCHTYFTYFLPSLSQREMQTMPVKCIMGVDIFMTHPNAGKLGIHNGTPCECCNPNGNGLPADWGYNPSSEGSIFAPEPAKIAGGQLDQAILAATIPLTNLENSLGRGGDEIIQIASNKIETIGCVMNDLKSIRVDPLGKIKQDGCVVAPQGTYNNFKPSPHVEYVDVVDMPGDYILTAMNKYKLLVGSKGINMQTTGPIDIYGTIVNFTGEQVNISSENEVLIDGGERLSLRGRKITMLPFEHNAVVVDGQLHVTRNTILQGGMMCEGEVGLLHITTTIEWQKTEVGMWKLYPDCEPIIARITIPSKGITDAISMITLPTHTHYFKNIPLTFLPHKEAVREKMITAGINSRARVAAANAVDITGLNIQPLIPLSALP